MTRRDRSRARPAGESSDSAQRIWLAGLGAFERAKSEGPRVFEALVEQGRDMGARAADMADQAFRNMREARQAGGRWDKLEQAFEERVSRSLQRLGVVTRREMDELARKVRDLDANVEAYMAASGGTARTGVRRKSRADSAPHSRRKARAPGTPAKPRAPRSKAKRAAD